MPFSLSDVGEPAVDPDRFRPEGDPYPGGWKTFPASWDALPEERLLARETLALVGEAIAELPERQHLVILMRDIEGWSAGEVCEALEISEANQRVLLHRARSKVRRVPRVLPRAGAGADMTCQELTEVLTDYLEGVMPPEDVARLEAHLELCEGCVTYVDRCARRSARSRALRAEEVEATVPDDVLAAFRAWKRGEPLPGT